MRHLCYIRARAAAAHSYCIKISYELIKLLRKLILPFHLYKKSFCYVAEYQLRLILMISNLLILKHFICSTEIITISSFVLPKPIFQRKSSILYVS